MAESISAKTAWALAKAIKGGSKKKLPTSGNATVVRVDQDGTHWVRISGSDVETPINGAITADAKPGDVVQYHLEDTRISITGNATSPSVGKEYVDDKVEPVEAKVDVVARANALLSTATERARSVAEAAKSVADAVNQHFFADTSGIHVTEATQDEWDTNHSGANVLINSIGQLFRDGLNNLLTLTTENGARALTVWDGLGNTASNIRAVIGETIQLGNAASGNVLTINASGMKVSTSPANDMMNLGLGLRAQEVQHFSDGTISSVPHVLTLSYTPQGGSIVVYRGVDSSYNPPEEESTYQYTISGKTLTITDSRLVGYKYLVSYTATDFEAVSLAVGSHVKANGARTIASGTSSQALGENSLASGYHAKAIGEASHAEGKWTEAAGLAAHAEGEGAAASGDFSHAEGFYTRADGLGSHAQNSGTVAASEDQTALGRFNVEDSDGTYAVIIGNGTDGNHRSNALTVDWGGRVECGSFVTAQYQLVASGATDVALRANTVGNRGLYDVTNDEWILYRDTNDNLVLGSLKQYIGSCTVNTSNATIAGNVNYCWNNGAVCTITITVNLKASLATNSTVTVATAPSGYRPAYSVIGQVYITGQNPAELQARLTDAGAITLNNRSGSAVTTSANVYISFTFAL